MIQKPQSPSEVLNQATAIHCSFAITGKYSKETVQSHWNQLMKNYPYCVDYEWAGGIFEKENKIIEITIENQHPKTIQHAIRIVLEECHYYAYDTRSFGKEKSSLLIFSTIEIENKEYTIFGMYQCHSRTDFKSVIYFMEDFLNYFDETFDISSSQVIPMGSCFSQILEQNCIPSKERSIEIKQQTPKNILTYDFTHIKGEEPHWRESHHEHHLRSAGSITLSQEEIKTFIKWCKSHNFSTQAVFWAIQLKTYEKLFERKSKNADTVVLMSPFDCRNVLGIHDPIIGMYIDVIYPMFPVSFIDLSIEEMAKQLTDYIRSVNTFNSKELDRYRDFIYNGHFESIDIPNTAFFSNVAGMKVMNRLTNPMKEKFVDFLISSFPRNNHDEAVTPTIYSWGLYNGISIITVFYNGIVEHDLIDRILIEMKNMVLSLSQ